MTEPGTAERRCAWCSAAAGPEATHCPACGAALAQREDLAGLVIPGVTAVDPALAAVADEPMRLRAGSPSQGMVPTVAVAAAMGGPVAAVALGGMAAVVAAEYLGARRPGASTPEELEAVGRPSEAARLVAERLEREEAAGPGAGPVVDDSAGNSDNSTRD